MLICAFSHKTYAFSHIPKRLMPLYDDHVSPIPAYERNDEAPRGCFESLSFKKEDT